MAAGKGIVAIDLSDKDVRRVLSGFTLLVKETDDKRPNSELRLATKQISEKVGAEIQRAAYTHRFDPEAAVRVASTTKVLSDRVPKIRIGNTKRGLFSGGATVNEVLFGNEFGAAKNSYGNMGMKNGGRRFPPKTAKVGRGNEGYYIFPTIRALSPFIRDEWIKMADELFRKWRSA